MNREEFAWSFFPIEDGVNPESGVEFHTACPFCGTGPILMHKGVAFYGEDRLIWWADDGGVWCRKCTTRRTLAELAEFFHVDAQQFVFDAEAAEKTRLRKSKHTSDLRTSDTVDNFHRTVVRDYWKKFGWTDETIERFRLGYGRMKSNERINRHLIPFRAQHHTKGVMEGWSFEGRNPDAPKKVRNVKTAGLTKGYFWLIEDDPADKTLYIAEGPKDAISLSQMGFKNVLAIFGTSYWDKGISRFVLNKGYSNAVALGDADDVGLKFDQKVASDLATIGARFLRWPKQYSGGYDITDLLQDMGERAAKEFIFEYTTFEIQRGYIPDFRVVQADYVPEQPINTTTVPQMRQEMPLLMADYFDHYRDRRKQYPQGTALILGAPPGAGKSYSLVQEAQRQAYGVRIQHGDAMRNLAKNIDAQRVAVQQETDPEIREEAQRRLERMEKKLAKGGRVNRVLFGGLYVDAWNDLIAQPGFDPDLWFNFQARNTDNCGEYEVVNALAGKGYNARAYCNTKCPLKAECERNGYLSQFDKMERFPITFVRHQHLDTGMVDNYRSIIIDENPTHVFVSGKEATLTDLAPIWEGWSDNLEPAVGEAIDSLVNALRHTLRKSEEQGAAWSGRDAMQQMSKESFGQLGTLMSMLDDEALEAIQPASGIHVEDVADVDHLPSRCISDILTLLHDEWPDYEIGKSYNSSLHFEKGKLIYYPRKTLDIKPSKALLIADGTANTEFYRWLTGRELEIYAPDVYDPDAQTIVFRGSDFTRSQLKKQIGLQLNLLKKFNTQVVYDILGEPLEVSSIPFDENAYNSAMLDQAMTLLKMVLERHDKVLFVSHMPIRRVLEERVKSIFASRKIEFGHYGALRGTNAYKDFDAVLMVGAHRVPYDSLHRDAMAWARLAGHTEYVRPDIIIKASPYHGREDGHSYPAFEDEFAEMIQTIAEVGEIRQALDRIRLHTSGRPKTAYLALSRPAARWVSDVYSLHAVIKEQSDTRERRIREFAQAYHSRRGKYPTYGQVIAELGGSTNTVAKILKGLKNTHVA
jgi:hypothetical protein